ncbi:MAG: hypothetical protein ACD_5C00032G0002 [uncultured bacterium]|nr:MAG: hypothetical protein ACD_5C00032G0002 [uncultured bacterium]
MLIKFIVKLYHHKKGKANEILIATTITRQNCIYNER